LGKKSTVKPFFLVPVKYYHFIAVEAGRIRKSVGRLGYGNKNITYFLFLPAFPYFNKPY